MKYDVLNQILKRKDMNYRNIPNTDLNVSPIGMGTWAIGNDYFGKVNDNESIIAIQKAIDEGINLIDTAPAYGAGHAEEIVGKATHHQREKVILATKLGVIRTKDQFIKTLKPEHIYKEIDESLKRLRTDVIDLYQIHWPDPNTPIEDSLEALMKIKEQGKFRYLGVSNFDIPLLEKVREFTEVVSLQPQYSLLKRDIEKEIIPYCRNNDLGVISYGTLAGGILTGKFREIPDFEEGDNRSDFYDFFHEPEWTHVQNLLDVLRDLSDQYNRSVSQIVINWTISQRGITSALVGAKNQEQAQSNAKAAKFVMHKNDYYRIDQAFKKFIVEASDNR
jgi:aryl-alcohol dehydrogenase-like predicted oxidoreductase